MITRQAMGCFFFLLLLSACANHAQKHDRTAAQEHEKKADSDTGKKEPEKAQGDPAQAPRKEKPRNGKPKEGEASPVPAMEKPGLRVSIVGLRDKTGMIRVALFSGPEGFPAEHAKALLTRVLPADQKNPAVVFDGLTPGTYALAVIHDANDNSALDRNFLGMPTEGFAVSNNPAARFGPPVFTEATFEYTPPAMNQELTLHYF